MPNPFAIGARTSVSIARTVLPCSEAASARAALTEVVPTPPLPSRKMTRWRRRSASMMREEMAIACALPAQDVGAPGQATSARAQHNEVVVADALLLQRLIERDRHRCRGGVAVLLDVGEYLLGRQAETFRDRIDDAQIGLMRHDQIHVAEGDAGARGDIPRDLFHALDCDLEQLRPLHVYRITRVAVDFRIERGARAGRANG